MSNSTYDEFTIAKFTSLSLISTDITASNKLARSSWPHRLWKFLVRSFLHAHEPRIWQECTRSGQRIWRAYDPQTGRSACCQTEAEMIDWLEQRMHRW